MLAPVASIKVDISTVFLQAGAFGTVPSSWAALEASTHVVSLEDEGIGGSGQATDQ
jgi:hypothetical protein